MISELIHLSFLSEHDCGVNALGSDRYSNPVQMVLEGWLLSIISFGWCLTDFMITFACFEKDKSQALMIIGRWNIKY